MTDLNISSELRKLYEIKSTLNDVIQVFQDIQDAQIKELENSQAVAAEIALSEVDDISTESYRKAMLFSALKLEKESNAAIEFDTLLD